jgi:2-oxo-4-hydroxy-4-carboxy-5-ureidoimidazoline decarboxylase
VTLAALNALEPGAARVALQRCCGSSRWAQQMVEARPFATLERAAACADAIWRALTRADWLEAFAAHPEIGARSADKPTQAGAAWSAEEQAGAAAADEETRRRLADANRDYRARFGYIFIVCATGKTAAEMLALLDARFRNDPIDELKIAAEEQRKITRLRLNKLLEESPDIP